jgi:flagellar basal-body rod protein FlgC
MVYDPSNPQADQQGYVQGAVDDLAGQLGDLILASRSYQANMSVFKESRDALQVATTLGRG